MFLLFICFFFLSVSACDDFGDKNKVYINPLDTLMSTQVEIDRNKYRIVASGVEYRAQIFDDHIKKCSVFVPCNQSLCNCIDQHVIEKNLSDNWYLDIRRRAFECAWLSQLTQKLKNGAYAASNVLEFQNSGFALEVAQESLLIVAKNSDGRKVCFVCLSTDECFYLGDSLYGYLEQLYIAKNSQHR